MAKPKTPRKTEVKTADYRHTREKRKNIPPAQIAAEGQVPRVARVHYEYSPHLPPVLRVDPTGKVDKLPELIATAGKRLLNESEQRLLAEALRNQQPWLEWAGKREQHARGFFAVDPVALHIHERISTQAILRAASREDVQRDLFADPQQTYAQAIQFYRHDVDWANRMILGDSLQVMTSLARREDLAGKVQMIYMDPPYGIQFSSNFQPQIRRRDVKDRDQDLSREPETVRAYRDTWTLGIHSYLSYVRDRLAAAKELLASTGSIFVQIGEANLHRVRLLLDEVFGVDHSVATITFKSAVGLGSEFIDPVSNYVLWYARDIEHLSARPLYRELILGGKGATRYLYAEGPSGEERRLNEEEQENPETIPSGWRPFFRQGFTSRSGGEKSQFPIHFQNGVFRPTTGGWRTNEDGIRRELGAERVGLEGNRLTHKRYFGDFSATPISNFWDDISGGIKSRSDPKVFVVQTPTVIIERCLLMSTTPGDLVFDPTCGGGTSAYVAEQWGRRWITCDTSRVALALARQRLMTARFPYYGLRQIDADDERRNPLGTWLTDPSGQLSGKCSFTLKRLPHVTLRSIARNTALDSIFVKHDAILVQRLHILNAALKDVTAELRRKLAVKLTEKRKREGKNSITEGERRRWELPSTGWEAWEVPFDPDSDWPKALADALTAYRSAWRTKMDEVNACIEMNAEMEELVDKPDEVKSIVRVTGPFTVEGVRPEELSIGEKGLVDSSPNEVEADDQSAEGADNTQAYLTQMVQHLRTDGLTFLGNQHRKFSSLDPLFEAGSGSLIHAEGAWEGAGDKGNAVAITFGPQHGPVTALQLEEAIRSAKQYDELVVAGFSFDAEAYAVAEEQSHPKLRVHLTQIRPDLNQAMQGLLKDTPNSQLFTVFGQPDVEVNETKEGWICSLNGVEIYNPVDNTVRSSGADKVAAWFLDSDFDGRCFCITQAFFPDQNAWDKIAKALGSSADPAAFEALKGTTSLPFQKGKYGRVAVKVIDPRGNEVMAVRKLGGT